MTDSATQEEYNTFIKEADYLLSSSDPSAFSADWVKGQDFLDKAIALAPLYPEAYYKRAIYSCYERGARYFLDDKFKKSDYLPAFENIIKALELDPKNVEYYKFVQKLFLGYFRDYATGELSKTGLVFEDVHIDRIAKIVNQAIETTPASEENLELYQNIFDAVRNVLMRYKTRSLEQAMLKLIEKIVPLHEQEALKYKMEQALIIQDLESPQKGSELYKEILRLRPTLVEDVINDAFRNENWKLEGNLVDTITHLSKILRLEPDNAFVYYSLARIIEHHYPDSMFNAIDLYRKSIAFQKDEKVKWYGDCHYNLARLLSVLRLFDQALISINQAQKAQFSNPRFSLEKGRILKCNGQVTEAFKEFEIAQRLAIKAIEREDRSNGDIIAEIVKEKEELLRHFGQKIMQEQITNVKEALEYDSNTALQKDMSKIEADPILKDYFDQLTSCFSNLYSSSFAIKNKIIKLDTDDLWNDIGARVLTLLPFYGNTMEKICATVLRKGPANDMVKKAQNFCLLAENQAKFDAIAIYLARKIVLNPVKKYRLHVLHEEAIKEGDPLSDTIKSFCSNFENLMGYDQYKLRSTSPTAILAVKDACILISRFIYNDYLLKMSEEKRNDEILDLFFNIEEDELEELEQGQVNGSPTGKKGGLFGCFKSPPK